MSEKNEDDKSEEQENISKKEFVRSNLKEFTSHTSLHGFQYLGEGHISLCERIWWFVSISISVGLCAALIASLWNKWDSNPVIVSFAETSLPVYKIPFPAITICSETMIFQSHYKSENIFMSKNDFNATEDDEKLEVSSAAFLCENSDYIDYDIFPYLSESADVISVDFLKNVFLPPLKSISKTVEFLACNFSKFQTECDKMFFPITTDKGFCSTFNLLDSKEMFTENAVQYDEYDIKERTNSTGWTLEFGYKSGEGLNTFPKRGTNPSSGSGLSVILTFNNEDIDYLCTGSMQGFRISLDSPANIPRMRQQYFMVPFMDEVIVSIKPQMIYTSPGLKKLEPEKRKCYTTEERQLYYFKIYTQRNCEMECLSNVTFEFCKCVTYWMPREKHMEICPRSKKSCIEFAEFVPSLLDQEEIFDEQTKAIIEMIKEKVGGCHCLPVCSSLTYEVEVSQIDYRYRQMMKTFNESGGDENKNASLSKINFIFKDNFFIPSRRSELYGVTDFLANCGGILGLFLGFSILSLVEIIYFFTLRPACVIRNMFSGKINNSSA